MWSLNQMPGHVVGAASDIEVNELLTGCFWGPKERTISAEGIIANYLLELTEWNGFGEQKYAGHKN